MSVVSPFTLRALRGLSVFTLVVALYGCALPKATGALAAPAVGPTLAPKLAPLWTLDELAGERVLLVTHPTPHIIQALRAVVQDGALGKGVVVVGVFHKKERRSYKSSRAYLAKIRDPRFGLLGLDCKLGGAAAVYRNNGCSADFGRLLAKSAGIVFTGGADIPPALYGEETLLTTVLRTPFRQYWEISLLAHLLGTSRNTKLKPLLSKQPRYTILGICMGMQAMNVATGGTLVQDIPSEIYGVKTLEAIRALPADARHRSVEFALRSGRALAPGVYHRLRFSGAKELWSRLAPGGTSPAVLSVHHQAIEKVGVGLEVIATSVDGKVPEAVRHRRFPHVFAVQFHPEYYYRDRAIDLKKLKGRRVGGAAPSDPLSIGFHRRLWGLIGERLAR